MNQKISNLKLRSQSGAALAISLIILLVLTLVVVSSTQNGVVQERMAYAVRDAHISLEDAEIGVAAAQTAILGSSDTTGFTSTGSNGLYAEGTGPTDFFAAANWGANNSVLVPAATGANTRYFIQHLGTAPAAGVDEEIEATGRYGDPDEEGSEEAFRIVVRATGESGNAERILVSYFGMLY